MRNRTLLTFGVAALAFIATASARGTSPAAPAQKSAAAPAACDVDAYVVDPDPKGLNVRDAPGVHGRVVATIPLDGEGTNVHIVASDASGWVQIDRAETIMGAVVFDGKKGWVSGNMLGIATRGYDGKGVKLYPSPRAEGRGETPVRGRGEDRGVRRGLDARQA
ncbi:MAG TPA: SH3 domain-containing protein [Pyrinomonadaceae bacterium]|nr:SH3 domain-containing protein [Pyrinomonadaceae bacterium]